MQNPVGINLLLWTTEVRSEHLPLVDALAGAGYDGVELPLAEYPDAWCDRLASHLDGAGIRRTASTMLPYHCQPISADAAERGAASQHLRRDIERAARLGAELLVGPIHSAHKRFSGAGPTTEEVRRCAEFLHEMGEFAATFGISLAVEYLNRFECYLLNTAQQTMALCEMVDHPAVGVLFDTHHANIEEQCLHSAIDGCRARLKHVHISESHRGTPGTGQVDWPAIFEGLNEADFAGWLTIEAFGTTDRNLAQAANVWRNCFGDERSLYTQALAFVTAGMTPTTEKLTNGST